MVEKNQKKKTILKYMVNSSSTYFLNVCLFLRESISRGGAEKGGGQRKGVGRGFELGSVLTADSPMWGTNLEPDVGLEVTNCEIMT